MSFLSTFDPRVFAGWCFVGQAVLPAIRRWTKAIAPLHEPTRRILGFPQYRPLSVPIDASLAGNDQRDSSCQNRWPERSISGLRFLLSILSTEALRYE
jgi:hypothetical protein